MKGVLYNSQYSVLPKLTRNWLNSKSRGTMLTHVEQVLSTEFCLETFRNFSRAFNYFIDIPISKTNLSISIVNTGVLRINATYRPMTGKNTY